MTTELDHTMSAFVQRNEVPGLLTVVMREGKPDVINTYGVACPKSQQPYSLNSIFRLFSMTKPITAVAVLQAIEHGRCNLDDPIALYLPEFTHMQVLTPDGLKTAKNAITIGHLLTHMAGFTYSTMEDAVAAQYRESDFHGGLKRLSGDTIETHVKQLATFPLLFEPGTRWNYGESFGVLGRLLEVLYSKSLRAVLHDHIFIPLGMTDTDFYVPPENADRLVPLFDQGPDGLYQPAEPDLYGGDYTQKPSLLYGGAGLVGTPSDYMRFTQMLLNNGQLDGVQILQPTSVKTMLSNHLPAGLGKYPLSSLPHPITEPAGLGFGLGGAIAPSNAPYPVSYSWGGWANTEFWIDTKNKLAGFVFAQVIPNVRNLSTRGDFIEQVYRSL